jgi:hypothetical protein
MKRFAYIVVSVAVFLLIGRSLCLVLAPRGIGQSAALAIVAGSTDESSGAATFCLTNHGQGAIFLSRMNVEAKTPGGWRVVGQVPPNP